jgi:hypothetical protein
LTLVSRTTSGFSAEAERPVPDGGQFEFRSVFPGSYDVVATARIDAGGGAFWRVGGRTAIDVGNFDLDRVVVVMSPAIDISGQVTLDGIPESDVKGLHPVVTLRNESTARAFSQLYASFSSTERFVVNDAIEGDYRIEVTDLPAGTYVKSIRFGAADLSDGILHLDPRSTDRLDIVLGTNVGALDGIVTDKDQRPLADAAVVLVPNGPLHLRADPHKNAFTDEAGRFRLQGIAPGDYLLFASEDIEGGLWLDPSFVERNRATGRRIHIGERTKETIEIIAIPFAF